MRNDSSVLDEIIYARVLITLQRMQLDEQDRKLRDHLAALVGTDIDATIECQESLKRAWERASETLGIAAESQQHESQQGESKADTSHVSMQLEMAA